MELYAELIEHTEDKSILTKLSFIRSNKRKLKFNEGPYHFEEFPGEMFCPEDMVLNGHTEPKDVSQNIINLLSDLKRIRKELMKRQGRPRDEMPMGASVNGTKIRMKIDAYDPHESRHYNRIQ